jgi:GT2 family glycosyltransferase
LHPSTPIGVTVVVPTLNRGASIVPALETLLDQDHRPLEIFVVDQSETVAPEVLDLAKQHPDEIRVEHVTFRGLPRARNYGWQRAKYDAIVYVDDDVICQPQMVSEHLRSLQRDGVAMAAGGIDGTVVVPVPGGSLHFDQWRSAPCGSFGMTGEQESDHVPGGNFSVWRWVVEKVGGFDEALGAASAMFEELECCLRVRKAGLRIVFCGSARLTHLGAESGGCKVGSRGTYAWGVARNRTVLIRRHVSLVAKPVALAWLLRQCLGLARNPFAPGVVWQGLRGMAEGWRVGGMKPAMTDFPTADSPRGLEANAGPRAA